MKSEEAVLALSALAQSHRLAVFRQLVVAGQAGLTPGALLLWLSLPAPTLSFHLKELLGAGLVSQERDGRNLIYRARFDQMRALLGYLTENCCGGVPCAPALVETCDPLEEPS